MPNLVTSYKRKNKAQDRTYAKMGSKKDLELASSPQAYSLNSLATKSLVPNSHGNLSWNIQVVTDIQVRIEGNRKEVRDSSHELCKI